MVVSRILKLSARGFKVGSDNVRLNETQSLLKKIKWGVLLAQIILIAQTINSIEISGRFFN